MQNSRNYPVHAYRLMREWKLKKTKKKLKNLVCRMKTNSLKSLSTHYTHTQTQTKPIATALTDIFTFNFMELQSACSSDHFAGHSAIYVGLFEVKKCSGWSISIAYPMMAEWPEFLAVVLFRSRVLSVSFLFFCLSSSPPPYPPPCPLLRRLLLLLFLKYPLIFTDIVE